VAIDIDKLGRYTAVSWRGNFLSQIHILCFNVYYSSPSFIISFFDWSFGHVRWIFSVYNFGADT